MRHIVRLATLSVFVAGVQAPAAIVARSAPLVVDGDVAKPLKMSAVDLDPAFIASGVMVADLVDGKPLADGQGPLRLVAPKDLHGSRSVRLLQRLQVVRLRK